MPDFDPAPDFATIAPDKADELYRRAAYKQNLLTAAATIEMSPIQRRLWTRTYMEAQFELLRVEREIGAEIIRIPWTVHVAGAPGVDENYACGSNECDNPYCGQVQKCARCHDVLHYGFSGPGQLSEMTAQMFGGSIQGYMEQHFGANPVDAEGPSWYPVGTRVAKRSMGIQCTTFLPDDGNDGPELGSNEYLRDCDVMHEEIARSMAPNAPPPWLGD